MKQLCRNIKEWNIKQLYLGRYMCLTERNLHATMMKEIAPVGFVKMELLDLPQNSISSIECICRIFMPMLVVLHLSMDGSVGR
jgi:hypothetical protein